MSKGKLLLAAGTLFVFTMLATGCVFGPSEDSGSEPIDPPQIDYSAEESPEITFEISESEENAEGVAQTESTQRVERTLYVFDHQGYVTPITVKVPYTKAVATQALQFLVAGGPVTPLLPDGMRAVLPADTELTVDLNEDGTAIVDFSKEFRDYRAQDEKGILEAITWTLTQFDTIKAVQLQINGNKTDVMPVNGTPIGQSLSRKDGINIEVAEDTSIGNSSTVTLYFKSQSPGSNYEYFVPVTRLIPKSDDLVLATVEELIEGPMLGSGLFSDIVTTTQLLDANIRDQMVTLNFDEQFLQFTEESSKASDDALTSLVLSLTESGLATQVQFMVNGESEIASFQGGDLSKPVSRPVSINQTGF